MKKLRELTSEDMNYTSKVFISYTPQDFKTIYEFDTRKIGKEAIPKVKDYGSRATIALIIEDGYIKYGISICDENDKFDKEFGRNSAINRMKMGMGKVPLNNYKGVPNNLDTLALHFLNNLTQSVYMNYGKYKQRIGSFEKTSKEKSRIKIGPTLANNLGE